MEEKWNRGGLVEVLNSSDANYVHIAHTLLTDKGYFVRIENEHTYTNVVTGISLMVKEEEAESAIKDLEEAGIIPSQSENIEELNESAQRAIRGSNNKIWKVVLLLLIILLLLAIYTNFIHQTII